MPKDMEQLQQLKLSLQREQPELPPQGAEDEAPEEREFSQPLVKELRDKSSFNGVLLVRSADIRTGKTGRAYMDLKLCDVSGELVAKVWNIPDGAVAPKSGTVLSVTGGVEEYNKQLQLRVQSMKPVEDLNTVDMAKLVPAAPESPAKMRAEIDRAVESFRSEDLKKLVNEMLRMADEDGKLLKFPAAQRMHHAELSGLLHHTTSMLRAAESLVQVYNELYPELLHRDLVLAGVIIHDLAKINEMQADDFGNVSDYTMDGLLVGHIVRGVCNLELAARRVGVSGELVELLQHMLLSHHGIPEYGSPRQPMFPEAELLHILDLTDARMNELKGIQDRTEKGAFSERINSLDGRRIYHPRFTMSRSEPEDM